MVWRYRLSSSLNTVRFKGSARMIMFPVGVETMSGARILDRAERVLVALRRYPATAAFEEIVAVSNRHWVPALRGPW